MTYQYTEEDGRFFQAGYDHFVAGAGTAIISLLSDQDFMAKLTASERGGGSDFEDQLVE